MYATDPGDEVENNLDIDEIGFDYLRLEKIFANKEKVINDSLSVNRQYNFIATAGSLKRPRIAFIVSCIKKLEKHLIILFIFQYGKFRLNGVLVAFLS